MGWVSYLEDITERLTQDLEKYRDLAIDEKASSARMRVQVESLLAACDRALDQIQLHVELATDPDFDMAYEITELDKEKTNLEREISDLHNRRGGLTDEIQRLQSEGKDLKLEVRTLKRNIALQEEELNRVLSENPDLAYEVYSQDPSDH